jgi:hypothetical protein
MLRPWPRSPASAAGCFDDSGEPTGLIVDTLEELQRRPSPRIDDVVGPFEDREAATAALEEGLTRKRASLIRQGGAISALAAEERFRYRYRSA